MTHPEEFDGLIADARQRLHQEKERERQQDQRDEAKAQRIAKILEFGRLAVRQLLAANVQPIQIKVLKYHFWGASKCRVGKGWEVSSSLYRDPENYRSHKGFVLDTNGALRQCCIYDINRAKSVPESNELLVQYWPAPLLDSDGLVLDQAKVDVGLAELVARNVPDREHQ